MNKQRIQEMLEQEGLKFKGSKRKVKMNPIDAGICATVAAVYAQESGEPPKACFTATRGIYWRMLDER